MIKRKTVFVVGAGASVPFGFPTGLGLLREVQQAELQTLKTNINSYLSMPTLIDFASRLRDCQELSIDAFLEYQQPKQQVAGKRLIANKLLRCEADQGYAKSGDWIAHLFDLMSGGVKSTEEFFGLNNVKFITYNYDRLIETKFAKGLAAKWGTNDPHLLRKLSGRVTHLHGSLGDLDPSSNDHVPFAAGYVPFHGPGSPTVDIDAAIRGYLDRCERTIKIVHEPSDNDAAFETARSWLSGAEIVFFLGFGFGMTNVDRLQFAALAKSAHVHYTWFGMTGQERAVYVTEPFNRAGITSTYDSAPAWDSLQLIRERVGELITRYPT